MTLSINWMLLVGCVILFSSQLRSYQVGEYPTNYIYIVKIVGRLNGMENNELTAAKLVNKIQKALSKNEFLHFQLLLVEDEWSIYNAVNAKAFELAPELFDDDDVTEVLNKK